MGSKKPTQEVRINPSPTASGTTDVPVVQLAPTFRGPSLVLCWFPHCQFRVSELPLSQKSCFHGYPHHVFDPFAHIIALPSLRMDFGSSAQCLAVDPCICFHRLQVKGSMMTIKVVINLITGESQIRHPLHYCLGS